MDLQQYTEAGASSEDIDETTENRLDWLDQLPFQADYKVITYFLKQFKINSTEDFLEFVRKFDKALHGDRFKVAASEQNVKEAVDADGVQKEADAKAADAAKTDQDEHHEPEHQIRDKTRGRIREIAEAAIKRKEKEAELLAKRAAEKSKADNKQAPPEDQKEEDAKATAVVKAEQEEVEVMKHQIREMEEAEEEVERPNHEMEEAEAEAEREKTEAELLTKPGDEKAEADNKPTPIKDQKQADTKKQTLPKVQQEGEADKQTTPKPQEKGETKEETEQEAKDRKRREAGELTDTEIMDALPPDFRKRLETWQTLAANQKDSLTPAVAAVRAAKAAAHAKWLEEKAAQNPKKANVLARKEEVPVGPMKKYQITRAQLWHWRTEHHSYHTLKTIRTPMNRPFFENKDFDVDDIPVCQYCTALGRSDRAPLQSNLADQAKRFWYRRY
ncbi:hypothetical protein N431DRAFT_449507 [Stipitochalara longipes BDJ]|nr:hypothetical protein N431DRAFT_449507 [Stipitochalara longipes BDJ]